MKKMRSVGPWVWALMWMGAARSGTTGSAAAIAGAASSWAAFSEAASFGTAGAEWLPAAAEVGANAMEGRRARTEAAKSEGEANASRSQAVGAGVAGTAEGPEDLGFPKGLRALLGGEPQMRRAANRDARTLRALLRCLGATARQALVLAWWKVRSWAGPAVSEGVAFAAVDVLEVLLTGGTSRPLHSAAQRLAALSGSLTSLIVGSAYTGLLLSCLTDPHFFREIQTLEDVAASVDRLYVTPGSMYVLSQEHDDLGLKTLKDKVRLIPIGHFDERNFSLHDVLRTGRAAVTMADYSYPVFSRNPAYTKDGKRLLHIVPQKIFSPKFLFYPVQRNNRFMVVFDRLLLRLLQGGFFNYWRRCEIENMIVTGQHADVESAEISLDPVRLAMEHMSGPFLILGVGSAIAICVFMAEYLTINRKFAIRIFLTIFICCPQRFIEWLLQKIK